MALRQFDIWKLNKLKERHSDITTPDAALNAACEAEDLANAVGPFDPAYTRFKSQQLDLEAMALLLEQTSSENRHHTTTELDRVF